MLYKVSSILVDMLVGEKSINNEKREVYLYGAMLFVSTIVGLLSVFLISIIFFDLITFLVFMLFFIPLRLYAGGYHCNNYGSCFIVSNVLFVLAVLCAKATCSFDWIPTVFSTVTLIMVIAFSPVTNKSNPLSERRRLINKKHSIFIVLLQFFLINLFVFIRLEHIDYYICLAACSGLSIVVLMFIEMFKERRERYA